jgi:hypothetical protein
MQGAVPPESPYSAAGDDQEGCLGCHCRYVRSSLRKARSGEAALEGIEASIDTAAPALILILILNCSKSMGMLRSLHIEGLPPTMTAAELSQLMAPYGCVQYAEVSTY